MISLKTFCVCCFLTWAITYQVKAQKKPDLAEPLSLDTIYYKVNRSPSYPGKRAGLISFIHSEVQYPKEAIKDTIEGVVTAKFMVSKRGTIRYVKIVDSLCEPIHKQVKVALGQMPRWEPGYKNGEPVNTWMYLPLRFDLVKN